MFTKGRSVSSEMYLFKDEWCDECGDFMDEGDPFHFVDGDKWCKNCVNALEYEDEETRDS